MSAGTGMHSSAMRSTGPVGDSGSAAKTDRAMVATARARLARERREKAGAARRRTRVCSAPSIFPRFRSSAGGSANPA
ncbi:hypothetical protein [Nocardia terpenica]|uniref:hypothetical protein n=1 Tax=Nocardia terpenica TaxID=455432 RepID=UPI0012FD5F4B|nr:hypothetical protein [Nocardia terpenica]